MHMIGSPIDTQIPSSHHTVTTYLQIGKGGLLLHVTAITVFKTFMQNHSPVK